MADSFICVYTYLYGRRFRNGAKHWQELEQTTSRYQCFEYNKYNPRLKYDDYCSRHTAFIEVLVRKLTLSFRGTS